MNQGRAHTRRQNTQARNERIREKFNYLYNVKRKRFDDVIQEVADHFGLAIRTIERILKEG